MFETALTMEKKQNAAVAWPLNGNDVPVKLPAAHHASESNNTNNKKANTDNNTTTNKDNNNNKGNSNNNNNNDDDRDSSPSTVIAAAAEESMTKASNTAPKAIDFAPVVASSCTGHHHSHHSTTSKKPALQDVVLNENGFANPKFSLLIQQHQRAFSLATTSLSAQTLIVQSIISRVEKKQGKFLEKKTAITQNHQNHHQEQFYEWMELSPDEVMLGVAKVLRLPTPPPPKPSLSSSTTTRAPMVVSSKHTLHLPCPIATTTTSSDQLQFASVLCLYSTPLFSYHAPMYEVAAATSSSSSNRSSKSNSKARTKKKASTAAVAVSKSKKGSTTVTKSSTKPSCLKKRSTMSSSGAVASTTTTTTTTAGTTVVAKKRRMGPAIKNNSVSNNNNNNHNAISFGAMLDSSDIADELTKKATTILQSIQVKSKLPRGVTQRGSNGKYQAQFYFQGSSRYIGVFDTHTQAAKAYECVHRLLAESRPSGGRKNGALRKAATTTDSSIATFEKVREAVVMAVMNHCKTTKS